jgi:hypothetical protein
MRLEAHIPTLLAFMTMRTPRPLEALCTPGQRGRKPERSCRGAMCPLMGSFPDMNGKRRDREWSSAGCEVNATVVAYHKGIVTARVCSCTAACGAAGVDC